MPIIPALRKLRQEDHKLESTLGYIVAAYLKNKQKQKITVPPVKV
jgi:hypothetical protein